jgi:calcium-dependent protein kinase
MISQIDVDGSGFIDYTEFIAATINKQKILSKEKLEMAFKAFDLDGSGKIGIDELKHLLEKDGKLADDSEWMKVLLEADEN